MEKFSELKAIFALDYSILLLSALLTSIISGFAGVAGGILLLAVMSIFLPASALIPIHGLVQLGSNSSRVFLLWKHIDRKIIPLYLLGGVLGAAIGSQVVVSVEGQLYSLALGTFILIVTWLPRFKSTPKIPGKWMFIGVGATFLSLVFGAIGPLLAPFFLRERISKESLVVTKATCQMIGHLYKTIVFGFLGFAFADYSDLLIGMLAAVVLGNYIGKQLLGKVDDRIFRQVLKWMITALAVRMIVIAF